jgi:hypothetical protein
MKRVEVSIGEQAIKETRLAGICFAHDSTQMYSKKTKGNCPLLLLKSLFPQSSRQHTQMPRMPTLKATHNNIESTIKTRANSARNTIQKHQQPAEHKQKSQASTAKKFFQTHTNR